MLTNAFRRSLGIAALLLWAAGVGSGLYALLEYQNAPGPGATAPAAWPAGARIPRPDGRPVLVLALHPQCACSRATLAELSRLLARAASRADVHVVFVAPPALESAWASSDLRAMAAAVPGVHVMRDDGTEARRFGARVSGQLLAYDARGELAFSGGITGSRGHEGDNAGRAAVEALLAGRPHPRSTFVFGCLLFGGRTEALPESSAS